jgi:hypothetical protein
MNRVLFGLSRSKGILACGEIDRLSDSRHSRNTLRLLEDRGEKPIDKTAWIRKRDEMATGQRVDGHVQSFLGHAPLESIGKNWSI